MKIQEKLEELRSNNIRIKALIDLYERSVQEEAKSEQELEIKKTKAKYLRKVILRATTLNDKLLKKIH